MCGPAKCAALVDGLSLSATSNDALPDTFGVGPIVTAGFLGVGKILPPHAPLGPDRFDLGWAATGGIDTHVPDEECCLWPTCGYTGPAP